MKIDVAADILRGLTAVSAMRPTHCGMWISKIRKALVADGAESGDCHYNAYGCVTYFTDPEDGQRYQVEIRPVTKGASE